ncbi:MAG: hypothetical protein AAF074_11255 [Pseudomonadota bacterium]
MQRRNGETVAMALALGLANAEVIARLALILIVTDGLCVILFGGAPRMILNFLFWSLVIYVALRTLLSNGRVAGVAALFREDGSLPWRFLVRAFLLNVPGVLAILMIGGLLLPALGQAPALAFGIAAGLCVHAATLALFGSMLVDIANGGDGDAERALARGRTLFLPVTVMMLSGPALAELILLGFERILVALDAPLRTVAVENDHASPVGFVLDALLLTGSAVVSVLTAVVLGRAWQRAV